MSEPILSIRDLRVAFPRRAAPSVTVVDGVGFDVMPGEIVGVVGESGSGKSMTARSVLRLLPKTAEVQGSIRFRGDEVLKMSPDRIREMRGALVSMVFQDPMTSFNPAADRRPDRRSVAIHDRTGRASLGSGWRACWRGSALPTRWLARAPIRMNSPAACASALTADGGGQWARAADRRRADHGARRHGAGQILRLMRDLNEQSGTGILLITHNIAVVASLCRRLIVMYAGRVVEDGPTDEVLSAPQHPYTWSLLQSVPRIDRAIGRLTAIKGQPPDPAAPLGGCKFHPR
jgi:ABC-type dipeptide/oligopeptide/nickel transport system ATPase component